jgi:threonine synthase
VTMARHYGLRHLAVASTGDAAEGLAAYAAAALIAAHVFLPKDAAFASYVEGVLYGADVTTVDGSIADCARMVGERIGLQKEAAQRGEIAPEDVWFDVSSLKEPFRMEGEKTVGYELVEQLGWEYPDAVLCPNTTVLIGMWKAFEEMEQLDWVRGKRPRLYAATSGAGRRASTASGEGLVLEIVGASGGSVLATDEAAILGSTLDWARNEGIFLSPGGGAAAAGYATLLARGEVKADERVVLLNAGSGRKFIDAMAGAMRLRRRGDLPTSLPVGGIITPV